MWDAAWSGFREIAIGWDLLESVGLLAPFLAQRSRRLSASKHFATPGLLRQKGTPAKDPPSGTRPESGRPAPADQWLAPGTCASLVRLFACIQRRKRGRARARCHRDPSESEEQSILRIDAPCLRECDDFAAPGPTGQLRVALDAALGTNVEIFGAVWSDQGRRG